MKVGIGIRSGIREGHGRMKIGIGTGMRGNQLREEVTGGGEKGLVSGAPRRAMMSSFLVVSGISPLIEVMNGEEDPVRVSARERRPWTGIMSGFPVPTDRGQIDSWIEAIERGEDTADLAQEQPRKGIKSGSLVASGRSRIDSLIEAIKRGEDTVSLARE